MDIQALLQTMTLEEKASLLSGLDSWYTKPIERLNVNKVMVSDGPHGLRKWDESKGSQDSIKAVCFPAGCATAASFDRETARKLGRALGESARHEHVGVVLGPAVNIKRSPLCGRNFEYFSEDPCLAGELAAALVDGLQSEGVGASVKHFAANSQENRRMSANSVMDDRTLRELYLAAFETIVKRAKPWTMMCSYNRINGVYSSDNDWLLNKLLRDEWGFDGLVMSDWGAVNDRVQGVKAGLDLEMPSSGGENDRLIVEAVQGGRLSMDAVDRCVENVLRLVQRCEKGAERSAEWNLEEQHALARELAAECMVLLKNDGGVLPLQKGAKLAVIGGFAKNPRFQGGGSSHINCFRKGCAWELLKQGATYAEGYAPDDGDTPNEALIAEAVEAAKNADVAIVFAGLPDAYECEGYDRTHLRMPESHNALIERVAEVNPNTVVVLHNGSPVQMPWLGKVRGVLEAYLTGQAGGEAVAQVLLGEKCPSGRLPETFPLKVEDTPCFPWFGGEGDTCEYREGVFVGYRWYNQRKADVLFPFGYGLSYTKFDYRNLKLGAAKVKDTDTLEVSVDVTNVGAAAGKEVVQLYVAAPENGGVIRPVRELRAFDKVALDVGETKTVRFKLDKRAFAHWDAALGDWRVESGEYRVQIGLDSRTIVLDAPVSMESTTRVKATYTMNSLIGDIVRDERCREMMEPILAMMSEGIGDGDDSAQEAITPEMVRAMAENSPLRNCLSFSGGRMTRQSLEALVERLNG